MYFYKLNVFQWSKSQKRKNRKVYELEINIVKRLNKIEIKHLLTI